MSYIVYRRRGITAQIELRPTKRTLVGRTSVCYFPCAGLRPRPPSAPPLWIVLDKAEALSRSLALSLSLSRINHPGAGSKSGPKRRNAVMVSFNFLARSTLVITAPIEHCRTNRTLVDCTSTRMLFSVRGLRPRPPVMDGSY